jgi:hypothetical protein
MLVLYLRRKTEVFYLNYNYQKTYIQNAGV